LTVSLGQTKACPGEMSGSGCKVPMLIHSDIPISQGVKERANQWRRGPVQGCCGEHCGTCPDRLDV